MSAPGLTFSGNQQGVGSGDPRGFSDSDTEGRPERYPSSKSPSDLLSSAFRNIKKITPGREDLAKLTRQPSQLALRRPSEVAGLPYEKATTSAPFLRGPRRPHRHSMLAA